MAIHMDIHMDIDYHIDIDYDMDRNIDYIIDIGFSADIDCNTWNARSLQGQFNIAPSTGSNLLL